MLQRLRDRLIARIRNRRFDDDLQEELRVHEALKREQLEAAGLSADDARAVARRALGNVTLMREDSRRVWIAPWLESLWQDARYAIRTLGRQPLHAATSLAVLVLAIGLNTNLFATFKASALTPWPARDPEEIVLARASAAGREVGPSWDELLLVKAQVRSLSGVAAYVYGAGQHLRVPGYSDLSPQAYFVSANFLNVMGVRMHLGSGFVAEDDLPGARRSAVVLSYFTWQNALGGDPSVVGREVSVNSKPFTIVGVLEKRFDGLGRPVGLWLPLSALSSNGPVMAGGIEGQASANCCIGMVARLADGADVARARTELQVLHDQFAASTRRRNGVVEVHGTSGIARPNADLDVFGMVAAAVGRILLLACANVGNLQLARGLARRREIATRLSIGASRARVIRQLLVEGLVLSLLAGTVSIIVSAAFPGLLLRLGGDEVAPDIAGRFLPDGVVVVFTVVVCAVAALAFALAPALHATRRTIPLGSLDRGSTPGSRVTLRGGLLAMQIAISTVLLAGAGVLTRAVIHAMEFDPGFAIGDVTRVSAYPPETPGADEGEFHKRLLAELERDPRARIALSRQGFFTPSGFYTIHVVLPGENLLNGRPIDRRSVSGRYFDVLGIQVIAGRTFASNAVDELVVNEAFARAVWQDGSPLGRTIREVDTKGTLLRTHTIVGIVRDAWLTGLDRIRPVVFRPSTSGVFMTRSVADVERIRAAAVGIQPQARVHAWPLRDDLAEALEESRDGAAAAWGLGILGLLLAAVGVFGVFAYAVEERRREIGVRMALGAARGQIVGMLVSTSGRAILVGLAAGLLGSLAAGPLLGSYLYGLSPLDPLAYGGVILLLSTAATAATFVPARRACRVDPAVTLRED